MDALPVGEAREKEQNECARVKALLAGGPWVTGLRNEGEVWMEDSIDMLKGIGDKARRKLEAVEIRIVVDMLMTTDDTKVEGCSRARLQTLRQLAAAAQVGAFPADRVIDHRLSHNPYESRYGGTWREEIWKSSSLKQYVCISFMIEHIVLESAKLFKGTYYPRARLGLLPQCPELADGQVDH